MRVLPLVLFSAFLPLAAAQVCVPGQTLSGGACVACPANTACPGSAALTGAPSFVCGAGKAPNADASACVWDGTTVCAPGTYRRPGSGYTK